MKYPDFDVVSYIFSSLIGTNFFQRKFLYYKPSLPREKVPRKNIPHHVYLYLLGHCFYKPGKRSVCVSLGERHDRRKHNKGTRTSSYCAHMPLSQLQVGYMLFEFII